MANTQLSWNGPEPESRDFPNSESLAQIVITKLKDGRFRIVCFDDHEVVDELATDTPEQLFELTDRLHSIDVWQP